MSESEALLRAILDAPDDDAPRLVYADWLDEHGDAARAAFIRAQVELARLTPEDPTRTRIVQSERTLLNANRAEWIRWLPDWASAHDFRRGFVAWIRCDARSFLAQGDDVRRKTPLEGVRLDGPDDIAVPVFRSRVLEGLRSLTLSINVPPLAWAQLAASPYVHWLSDLDLSSNRHTEQMVKALVNSSAFPVLRSLRLKRCALGDEYTAWLVQHRWAERLRALDLSNNHIGPEGGLAIAASPFLDGLNQLNLNGNPLLEIARVIRALRTRFGSRVRLSGS
jgi:uncharacterized protein (TIGR02996 family)